MDHVIFQRQQNTVYDMVGVKLSAEKQFCPEKMSHGRLKKPLSTWLIIFFKLSFSVSELLVLLTFLKYCSPLSGSSC